MGIQTYLPIILLVVFAAYAFFMFSKRKKGMQNLGPAFRRFLEQTGYRFIEMKNAPIEAHVQQMEHKTKQLMAGTSAYQLDLVREFHGVEITYKMFMGAPGGGDQTLMWCRWSMPLEKSPRVVWEAADKGLAGAGKAIKEVFTTMKRKWEPAYEKRIKTGDADIDKRFMVYGEDEQSVPAVLQSPGLKEALLSMTEVDLCVSSNEVFFSDPFQKNLRAGMGGTLGAMAVGYDYGKFMDLTIPVHDQIAELLALAQRASR